MIKKALAGLLLTVALSAPSMAQIGRDTTLAYSTPTLSKSPNGAVLLTWTEKDAQNNGSFCMAQSADGGKTFSAKQVIFSAPGLASGRLMRPKVLFKKDGSLVAVFAKGGNENGKRTNDIMTATSANNGATWSAPQKVDSDPTPCVRGFYDAVILPNDELAVTYLKDVAGSTKHEERNLRLVLTKNGQFLPERIIDAVVCDCCNISMLVDANGALNVYYRDNNDDIRDMARLVSTDNGATFGNSKILFTDNWKIAGCPHSGAVSANFGKSTLVTWFSGADTDKGVRLVTQDGKRLALANDPTARNGSIATGDNKALFVWEQNRGEVSQLGYRVLNGDKVGDTNWLTESVSGTNASTLVLGNQALVAYEVRNANKRNGIRLTLVSL